MGLATTQQTHAESWPHVQLKIIGYGESAINLQALDHSDQQMVAMKVIPRRAVQKQGPALEKDLLIQCRLRHPFVIGLKRVRVFLSTSACTQAAKPLQPSEPDQRHTSAVPSQKWPRAGGAHSGLPHPCDGIRLGREHRTVPLASGF